MLPRHHAKLDLSLFPGKVLVIFGSRQVGKTTLIKNYLASTLLRSRFESGENILIHETLGSRDFPRLKAFAQGLELLVIDEAQRVPDIGLALKILVDECPELRILVSGSSSFELAGQIGEPLTGRKKTITLYPESLLELATESSPYELSLRIPEFLVYGMYPAVLTEAAVEGKREVLRELVGSYLLRDVLELERVKASRTLLSLLRLLAWQVGSEVSHNELGQKLGLDGKTVARWLDLLEKAFVLFSLGGYSGNLRNEVKRKNKYYFYDVGIRNTLIANLNPLELRDDQGALWENFIMLERLKSRSYLGIDANPFFWRTWEGKEIDLVEERGGKLWTYEFKWNPGKAAILPKVFAEAYPGSPFEVVHRDNWAAFLLG
jgi:hypothetical protein